jgi:hypothetical protein
MQERERTCAPMSQWHTTEPFSNLTSSTWITWFRAYKGCASWIPRKRGCKKDQKWGSMVIHELQAGIELAQVLRPRITGVWAQWLDMFELSELPESESKSSSNACRLSWDLDWVLRSWCEVSGGRPSFFLGVENCDCGALAGSVQPCICKLAWVCQLLTAP